MSKAVNSRQELVPVSIQPCWTRVWRRQIILSPSNACPGYFDEFRGHSDSSTDRHPRVPGTSPLRAAATSQYGPEKVIPGIVSNDRIGIDNGR
jgi:hypothetical protein